MSAGELDLTPYPIDVAIALASVADELDSLAREICAEREALAAEVLRLRANTALLVAERDRLRNELATALEALHRIEQTAVKR